MSVTQDLDALHSTLEKTIGYQLIGTFISLAIYGITVLQTYLYYSNYHREYSKGLQALVAILWVLDTICSILIAYSLYFALVKNWGDPSVLVKAPVTFVLENGFNVLVTWIVQLFLAHRVWLVSTRRDHVPPILIVILCTGKLGGGLALTGRIFVRHSSVIAIENDKVIKISCIIDQGLAAAADAFITLGFCFHLRKSKDSKSGLTRTNNVVDSLMVFFVNRGALAIIFQVLALATYIGLNSQQNWMLWHLTRSKIYINSLLAILNARMYLKKKLNADVHTINVSGIRSNGGFTDTGSNSSGATSTSQIPEVLGKKMFVSDDIELRKVDWAFK